MSGGTTGTPKGVLGRHGAYVMSGLQMQAWTRSVLGQGDSVILLPLPLFHVYANVGVQALALVTGNPIALVPNPRDLPDLLATIRRVKPAFFNGVPTLYVALLNHPDVQRGKVDFKSIKICFSGAAALMADTKQRFESLTGGRIVEGYSLTEAMMALCVNPVNGPNKIGSVGMPLPDVHVRIFDGDEGTRELRGRRSRRDLLFRAATDDRVLESAGRNRRRAAAITANPAARAAGCTRAIWDISTRTATCSSSIARRI